MGLRTSIGRYTITGVLGEGGMGVVYSAHDDRVGRSIAIKMMPGWTPSAARRSSPPRFVERRRGIGRQ